MWLVHAYWWLEVNNLWKSVVAFFATLFLGASITVFMRPWKSWKRRRELQEKIADRLDTSTPGGLSDLMHALGIVMDQLSEGEVPDDNGSDDQRKMLREREPRPGGRSSIPNPVHGGGNAPHR